MKTQTTGGFQLNARPRTLRLLSFSQHETGKFLWVRLLMQLDGWFGCLWCTAVRDEQGVLSHRASAGSHGPLPQKAAAPLSGGAGGWGGSSVM